MNACKCMMYTHELARLATPITLSDGVARYNMSNYTILYYTDFCPDFWMRSSFIIIIEGRLELTLRCWTFAIAQSMAAVGGKLLLLCDTTLYLLLSTFYDDGGHWVSISEFV